MVEISTTTLVLSAIFVLATYVAFGWALWLGYRGMSAESPEFKEGGHSLGEKGTYDEHCMIGDTKCDDIRKARAA